MKWHLYKKDDPNTWPQIDCPMVVYKGDDALNVGIYRWSKQLTMFYDGKNSQLLCCQECYYAYVGYVPSGYKTLYPVICTCKDCPEGYDDNGYCMDYNNDCACGHKKQKAEYSIEEQRIWKEFE
jgi:hypothetical protein